MGKPLENMSDSEIYSKVVDIIFASPWSGVSIYDSWWTEVIDRLRQYASELRQLSAASKDEYSRRRYLEIAANHERNAKHIEEARDLCRSLANR